ncbi:MAG: ATP-binding cassette domain-containing protein, partial [Oleiphilaceae bacterium]|nr:ATP-binding cassette domain-containing protein [Oleiphilaceae bacterium]
MSGFDFHGLTASFDGERVIGPLSFRINEGEHVGLVGKSGAGKSTLIRLLYDRLEGKASLVPQGLGLVNALPVFHNVFMGQLDQHATWYNTLTLIRPFRRDKDAIRALLTELGIP